LVLGTQTGSRPRFFISWFDPVAMTFSQAGNKWSVHKDGLVVHDKAYSFRRHNRRADQDLRAAPGVDGRLGCSM
jgi:hypothetical protein